MVLKRFAIAMIACLISVCAAAQGVISVDTKSNVLPDGNVELILTVNLAPQWYMYSTEPVKGGPMATALTSQESPDYSPVGGLENRQPFGHPGRGKHRTRIRQPDGRQE